MRQKNAKVDAAFTDYRHGYITILLMAGPVKRNHFFVYQHRISPNQYFYFRKSLSLFRADYYSIQLLYLALFKVTTTLYIYLNLATQFSVKKMEGYLKINKGLLGSWNMTYLNSFAIEKIAQNGIFLKLYHR